MRSPLILLFVLSALLSVWPSDIRADFICRVTVSYKWKKGDQEFVVPWTNLVATGDIEDVAKEKAKDLAIVEKTRALEVCRRQHENLSGCISGKFSALARTYQSLGFSARKSMEDAISADCTSIQGQCLDGVSSDPECKEKIIEVESEEASPTPDPKGAKPAAKKK